MCRLLYVNSKKELSISDYLQEFAEVAKRSREYQGHGWGFAFFNSGCWNYYKNIKPIWEDNLTQFGKSNRIVAHARSAFKDEGIDVKNNMPFYDDKHIFIFNGELRGVKIKEDGRIGAEKIFNFIKRFDKGKSKDALQKGTEIITRRAAYVKAMNIILTDHNSAYVHSQFNEDDEYFTMHKKITDDTIIVCSNPFINDEGWEPIQNNSLMEYKCL